MWRGRSCKMLIPLVIMYWFQSMMGYFGRVANWAVQASLQMELPFKACPLELIPQTTGSSRAGPCNGMPHCQFKIPTDARFPVPETGRPFFGEVYTSGALGFPTTSHGYESVRRSRGPSLELLLRTGILNQTTGTHRLQTPHDVHIYIYIYIYIHMRTHICTHI